MLGDGAILSDTITGQSVLVGGDNTAYMAPAP